ncbi:MAG: fatty acid desaturase family protein [Myxococcota bacterium]
MDATRPDEGPSEAPAHASGTHGKLPLTKSELREVLALDDRRSAWTLVVNWGLVFASMALVGIAPNPVTVVVALCVIGGRQLGCAIVMHEAAHRTLFSSRAWNDRLGNWLGAHPVLAAVEPYRRVHLLHHAHTGTAADPDLALTTPFPITRASLVRKLVRDLTGQTGFQQIRAQIAGSLKRPGGLRQLVPFAVANGAIAAVPIAFGRPALALLWPIALLTTYRVALRIRSIAEHAMAGPAEDPLRNTRTTLVGPWERLLLAPAFVNYHLEHHLLMTVPHYRLPRLHALLREKGLLEGALVTAGGYREVLRRASGRAPETKATA